MSEQTGWKFIVLYILLGIVLCQQLIIIFGKRNSETTTSECHTEKKVPPGHPSQETMHDRPEQKISVISDTSTSTENYADVLQKLKNWRSVAARDYQTLFKKSMEENNRGLEPQKVSSPEKPEKKDYFIYEPKVFRFRNFHASTEKSDEVHDYLNIKSWKPWKPWETEFSTIRVKRAAVQDPLNNEATKANRAAGIREPQIHSTTDPNNLHPSNNQPNLHGLTPSTEASPKAKNLLPPTTHPAQSHITSESLSKPTTIRLPTSFLLSSIMTKICIEDPLVLEFIRAPAAAELSIPPISSNSTAALNLRSQLLTAKGLAEDCLNHMEDGKYKLE